MTTNDILTESKGRYTMYYDGLQFDVHDVVHNSIIARFLHDGYVEKTFGPTKKLVEKFYNELNNGEVFIDSSAPKIVKGVCRRTRYISCRTRYAEDYYDECFEVRDDIFGSCIARFFYFIEGTSEQAKKRAEKLCRELNNAENNQPTKIK